MFFLSKSGSCMCAVCMHAHFCEYYLDASLWKCCFQGSVVPSFIIFHENKKVSHTIYGLHIIFCCAQKLHAFDWSGMDKALCCWVPEYGLDDLNRPFPLQFLWLYGDLILSAGHSISCGGAKKQNCMEQNIKKYYATFHEVNALRAIVLKNRLKWSPAGPTQGIWKNLCV